MRRPTGLAALGLALVVVLGGCAPPVPQGVDRNLADEWPTFGEPRLAVPEAGVCSSTAASNTEDLTLEALKRLDSCTGEHATETFHVDTFTGAAASKTSIPTSTADLAPAWNNCGAAAKDYLGDDWRTARVRMIVFTPSQKHWGAGARWYRCEFVTVKSENGDVIARSGTFKDGLRGARPLAIPCANMVNETQDSFDDLADVPCNQPHKAEFMGVATANTTEYPDNGDKSEKAFGNVCGAMAATYLKMTRAQYDRHQQFNVAWWIVSEDRWALGDRSASCYVTTTKQVSISVRGYGNRNLP
jgi:hypothetical protein